MIKGSNIDKFLRGCSNHRDQLFCLFELKGETKRRLKDRFNEHRRTIDNPNNESKPTTAAEHFLSSPNCTANDMLLIPIEKIFSNRDSIRKAREAFLIQKGKTIDPDGLNIREETYQYCYLLSCYFIIFSQYTYL